MVDHYECTLAVIKPDAFNRATEIEKELKEQGFNVVKKMITMLSKSEAKDFYKEHEGKPFYDNLTSYISSGEIIPMILSKNDAIAQWRQMLGPTKVSEARANAPNSIRARFGSLENDSHNAAHGSDSTASAEREIRFFFPNLTIGPALTGSTAKEYLTKTVSPSLVEGLSELCKVKPDDPIVWLADWLLLHNPNKRIIRK